MPEIATPTPNRLHTCQLIFKNGPSSVPRTLMEIMERYMEVDILHEDPLIIQIDNFLTKKERDHIISTAKPYLERSTGGQS